MTTTSDRPKHSQPWLHQHGLEVQAYGTVRLFPLGLSADTRAYSCQRVNRILADTQIFYAHYKKHHWLMRGPTFYSLHLLLDKHAAEQLHKGTATAKIARTVVSGTLGLAVRHGAIPGNPIRDVGRIVSNPARPPRALTPDERNEWVAQLDADRDAVRKDLPDLCEWMLGTGVRIGEALSVSWDEVDLGEATVKIDHTLIRIKGVGLIRKARPKSAAGRRTLDLPDFALSMLRRRKLASGGRGPVFPDSRGGWRDPSNTSRDLRNARGSAEFAWVTSHVFRKTAATEMDRDGLTARQIADQLGHAKVSMTQDRYLGRRAVGRDAARSLDRAHRDSTGKGPSGVSAG